MTKKKSGLFGFIQSDGFKRSNFPTISQVVLINMGENTEDKKYEQGIETAKSPAILIFFNNIADTPNPFAASGFTMTHGKYNRSHLRIDRDYHSSNSEFYHRRNLSYCHATEYFVNSSREIIEVHYYFDRWGSYTHALCKKKDQDAVHLFTPSAEEADVLQRRATLFGNILETLSEAKQTKYLELVSAVQQQHADFLQMLQDRNGAKTEIAAKLEKIKELVNRKNALEDGTTDKLVGFLVQALDALEKRRDQQLLIATADTNEQPSATDGVTNETKPVASKGSMTKKKPKKSAKSLSSSKAFQLQQQIQAVKAELQKIQQNSKFGFDIKSNWQQTLPPYIKKFYYLQDELLLLGMCEDEVDGKARIAIHKLIADFETLAKPIALFEQALLTGNLPAIETLYSYCQENISLNLYDAAMLNWLQNAKFNAESVLVKNQRLVFDFLSENCELFNSYIRQKGRNMMSSVENAAVSFNIMLLAYQTGSHAVFSALLNWGINPFAPWYIKANGEYIKGIRFLILYPTDTEFYLQKLLEYGVSLTGDEPFKELFSLDASSCSVLQKRKAHNEINEAAHFLMALKIQNSSDAPKNISSPKGLESMLHPLEHFILQNDRFHLYPQLYTALLVQAEINVLLAVLAIVILRNASITMFLQEAQRPGVTLTSQQNLVNVVENESSKETKYLHTIFILQADESTEFNSFVTKLLCEISLKMPSMHDLNYSKTDLLSKAQRLKTANFNEVAAYYYMANILLISYKQEVKGPVALEFVHSVALTAESLIATAIQEKMVLDQEIVRSNQLPGKNNEDLNVKSIMIAEKSNILYADACKLYLEVLKLAYLVNANSLLFSSEVDDALNKANEILAGDFLVVESKARLNSIYQSLKQEVCKLRTITQPSSALILRRF